MDLGELLGALIAGIIMVPVVAIYIHPWSICIGLLLAIILLVLIIIVVVNVVS